MNKRNFLEEETKKKKKIKKKVRINSTRVE
jgi:hypothetical protein